MTARQAGYRLALAGAGFLPVTLIAASCFGVASLRTSALAALLPALAFVLTAAVLDPATRRMLGRAVVIGVLATALYDSFRMLFLLAGLVPVDPIPHIGDDLGLQPGWLAGYGWRYLLNGTGLALAFLALGLQGVRAGVGFGVFVCGGLVATLAVSPHGQDMLFPLAPAAATMAVGGHVIYGWVVGALVARGLLAGPTLASGDRTLPRARTPRGRAAAPVATD